MKFNADTVKILQNFSNINQSIAFKAGNELETISTTKTVWAKAKVSNTFESDFAIYDLSRFLGTLSMFPDSEVEILDKYLKLSTGNQSVKYYFADPSLIVTPPKKKIVLPPDGLVEFTLDEKTLETVSKAMKVLQLPEVAVVGEEGKIYVKAVDSKKASNDEFKIEVGENDGTFNMIFKWDNLKHLISNTYKVAISPKGLAKFEKENLEYFIAVESNSEG